MIHIQWEKLPDATTTSSVTCYTPPPSARKFYNHRNIHDSTQGNPRYWIDASGLKDQHVIRSRQFESAICWWWFNTISIDWAEWLISPVIQFLFFSHRPRCANFILEKINRINHLGFCVALYGCLGRRKMNCSLSVAQREWNRPSLCVCALIYVALLTLKIDSSTENHSRFLSVHTHTQKRRGVVPLNKSQFKGTTYGIFHGGKDRFSSGSNYSRAVLSWVVKFMPILVSQLHRSCETEGTHNKNIIR